MEGGTGKAGRTGNCGQDQTLQDVAVTCVQRLASQGVAGIIGPHRSTNAIAVSDTLKSLSGTTSDRRNFS